LTGKSKLVFVKCLFDGLEKLSAKNKAEYFDGQKELVSAGNPSSMIWGEPATWDHAMHMGMKESLAPSVEKGKKPDFGAEVFGISGDLE